MWASDRMMALLIFLAWVLQAFLAWQGNRYIFTPSQLLGLIPFGALWVFFLFRGYPVNISGLGGVNQEREKIYELIEKFDKWLEEHPEEK